MEPLKIKHIFKALQISRPTLCRYVNHARQNPERQRARDQEATAL